MRRFFKVLSASALLFGLFATAPVDAKAPERGDQVMVLNEAAPGELGRFGCPGISWFGTIDVAGTTYGMALYPLPGRITGNVLHYEESWKVWTEPFTLSDGMLDTCEPGEVVLAGLDFGTGSLTTGKFRSNGVVDEAADPFAHWLGRRVHQDGTIGLIEFQGMPFVGFYGNLRLN